MKTRLVTTLALGAMLVLVAGTANAQAPSYLCGGTWMNACASVSYEVNGNDLVITVRNIPLDLPGEGDASESVITRFLVQALDAAENPLEATDWGVEYSDVVVPGAGDWATWDDEAWELNQGRVHPKKGYQQFTLIGFDWTQEFKNTQGSCIGVIPGPTTACEGSEPEHHLWARYTLSFDDAPVFTSWAAQIQHIGSDNPCPPDDYFCESDWAAVPEPVTMVLLASGLAGLGGVGLRRRLRGRELIDG